MSFLRVNGESSRGPWPHMVFRIKDSTRLIPKQGIYMIPLRLRESYHREGRNKIRDDDRKKGCKMTSYMVMSIQTQRNCVYRHWTSTTWTTELPALAREGNHMSLATELLTHIWIWMKKNQGSSYIAPLSLSGCHA